MEFSTETVERHDNGMFVIDEPVINDIEISAVKRPVKSSGWLATFRAFNGEPKHAAFTTASAAKQWLAWKKRSDLEFTAHAEMSARGKINFKKD